MHQTHINSSVTADTRIVCLPPVIFLFFAVLFSTSQVFAQPVVAGNTISWPDDGWYQVQSAADYQSICEGGRSCTVEPGSYTVINLTTGVRFENIEVTGTSAGGSTRPVAPTNATLTFYSSTATEIFWDRAPEADKVVATEVIRDGVLIGNAEGNSFYDDTRNPDANHRYELIAVDVDGNRSEKTVLGLTEKQNVSFIPSGSVAEDAPAVALSNNTAVVLRAGESGDGRGYAGAAYVFTSDDQMQWVATQILTETSGRRGYQFAWSAAVDTETLVIGEREDGRFVDNRGVVHIYIRDTDGLWKKTQLLNASESSKPMDTAGH